MEQEFRPRSVSDTSHLYRRPITGQLINSEGDITFITHQASPVLSESEEVTHEHRKTTVYLSKGKRFPHGTVEEKDLPPLEVESKDSSDNSSELYNREKPRRISRELQQRRLSNSADNIHHLNFEQHHDINRLNFAEHHSLHRLNFERRKEEKKLERLNSSGLLHLHNGHHKKLRFLQHSNSDIAFTGIPEATSHQDVRHSDHEDHTEHDLPSKLWHFIMRRVKSAPKAEDVAMKELGGGQRKMRKAHAMSVPNLFSRRNASNNKKLPVFTVEGASDHQPVLSASFDTAADGRYGLLNPAFRQAGVHRIPLRRRSGDFNSEDESGSRIPSPLQLSTRNLRVSDDETASVSSSATSNASNDESDSSDESGDSGKVFARMARKKILVLSDDNIESYKSDVNGSRENLASHQQPGTSRRAGQMHHSRSSSAIPSRRATMENDLQGPQGVLFTARIFNRIGRKNGQGEILRNLSHVSHVYKGTILMTDILDGKISFVARSGRAVKEFVTETGSEPWCACITPRGHVAVTLRRQACVTVWCGNGTLVREFGHDILECPTGLACDRQGRFIVSDEKTNKVAFFSPTGEFLGFLGEMHHDTSNNNRSGNQKEGDADSNDEFARENQENLDSNIRRTDRTDNDIQRSTDQKHGMNGPVLSTTEGSRRRVSGEQKPVQQRVPGIGQALKGPGQSQEPFVGATANGVPEQKRPNPFRPAPERLQRRASWIDQIHELDEEEANSDTEPTATKVKTHKSTTTATTKSTENPTGNNNNNNNNNNRKSSKKSDSESHYKFSMPRYVCVTSTGKIVVSDSGNHCVKVFSPEGQFLSKIGSYGTGDGNLKVPYGICCDHDEHVYVADHYNDRVSVFSLQGEFLQHVLTSASGLSRPKSLAIRSALVRTLYIAHGGLRSNEVLVYRLVPRGRRSVSFTCDV